MNTEGQFLRDVALEGLTSKGALDTVFLPLSVAAFNMLIQEGFSPLKAGLLCDSRLLQNPMLAMSIDYFEPLLSDANYAADAAAWGDFQLQLLQAFVPPPSKDAAINNKQRFVQCVKPWSTSIFEKLVNIKESQGDLEETAQTMLNFLK